MNTREVAKLLKKHEPDFLKDCPSYNTAGDLLILFQQEIDRRRNIEYPDGAVYIIGNRKWGLCKIGYSRSPARRLRRLQTGCPFKLEILTVFEGKSYDFETALHKRAEPYHEHGEWFRIEGRLKNFIDEL